MGDPIKLKCRYKTKDFLFISSLGNYYHFHATYQICNNCEFPWITDPIRKKSLGEIVAGDCFTRTQYELKFKVETVGKILCEKTLTKDEVETFRLAIIEKPQYWMSFNNILFLTNVGLVDPITFPEDLGPRYYLVKHIDFYLLYNENQVVDIKSISDLHSAVNITEDAEITVNFTYSIFWKDSTIKSTKSLSRKGAAIKIEWWNSEEKSGQITFKPVVFWVLNLFLGFSFLAVLIFKYPTLKIRYVICHFSFPQERMVQGDLNVISLS